jgi:hypothetical protein
MRLDVAGQQPVDTEATCTGCDPLGPPFSCLYNPKRWHAAEGQASVCRTSLRGAISQITAKRRTWFVTITGTACSRKMTVALAAPTRLQNPVARSDRATSVSANRDGVEKFLTHQALISIAESRWTCLFVRRCAAMSSDTAERKACKVRYSAELLFLMIFSTRDAERETHFGK